MSEDVASYLSGGAPECSYRQGLPGASVAACCPPPDQLSAEPNAVGAQFPLASRNAAGERALSEDGLPTANPSTRTSLASWQCFSHLVSHWARLEFNLRGYLGLEILPCCYNPEVAVFAAELRKCPREQR